LLRVTGIFTGTTVSLSPWLRQWGHRLAASLLTVDAVLARDFPTIQGVILLFSFVYVMVNLLVDLLYKWLDPRVQLK